MNLFFEWFSSLFGSFKVWIVVPAWDVGIRVRLGKAAAVLAPGFHFRIPIVDEITLVNTRQRVAMTPQIDIGILHRPGYVRTSQAICGYRIDQPLVAIMSYIQPEVTISAHIQAAIVEGITDPDRLKEYVKDRMVGVVIEFVTVTISAEVRTLRIMNNGWGLSSGGAGGEGRF